MDAEALTLTVLLGIIWFLGFWILGGVFFAVLTLIRLGRIKKIRFSCLFTIWALICSFFSSYYGVKLSMGAIEVCMDKAVTKSEVVSSVFVCGFWGIFGVGAGALAVLLIGGFGIFFLSRSPKKQVVINDQEADVVF